MYNKKKHYAFVKELKNLNFVFNVLHKNAAFWETSSILQVACLVKKMELEAVILTALRGKLIMEALNKHIAIWVGFQLSQGERKPAIC